MGRWAPDARGRLEHAAMQLYAERGFDRTSVAEIAERAGLTERTFFRHFTDKREVLFSGAGALRELLVARVDEAPVGTPPLEAVVAAFGAAADQIFEGRLDDVRHRQAIIDANVELQERELIKLASLAGSMADALRRRGVGDPVSGLAAEVGVTVFTTAFAAWVQGAGPSTLSEGIRSSLRELRDLAA